MSPSFDERSKVWDQQKHRTERAVEVARLIRLRVPLSQGQTALEFGCGTGLLGLLLADEVGHMTFADTSSGMLEQVAKKIADRGLKNAVTLDLTIQSLTATYDLVFSLMVLHHIDDYRGQILALAKALRPGGFLCLCDLDSEDGSFHTDEVVPHDGFDRRDIEQICREAGLGVVESMTGFVNKKMIAGQEREFPMFFILGKAIAPASMD